MAGAEYIDLLSSSDEASAVKQKSQPILESSNELNSAGPPPLLGTDLFNQWDDFENTIHHDEAYNAHVTKKRRLSSSPKTQPAKLNAGSHGAGAMFSIADYASLRQDHGFTELAEDDPMLFTSSAHGDMSVGRLGGRSRAHDHATIQAEDSDCSLPEDIFAPPSQHMPKLQKSSSMLSERTRAILGGLSTQDSNSRAMPEGTDDEEEGRMKKSVKRSKKSALADGEKTDKVGSKERHEAKVRERQQAKEQKAKQKEEEGLRKREEKEKKAKQKQKDADIAEVNKAKLDKKDSTPEMIVDLPASLHGQPVDGQVREFLKNLGVETAVYQSRIPDVVKWRRKVKARWDQDEGRWEPLSQMQIDDEKHIMCILPAANFISLSTAKNDEEDLNIHVSRIKSAHPECTPIYLIEGLTKKLRESKTAANRQFQNEVLNQDPSTDNVASSQPTKRKKALPLIVDEEVIEDALLRLQVIHNCLIHHTATHVDTAEWIATFTQHISTIPYKLTRLALTTSTSSCLEPGQIRTGSDPTDTYSRILQEIIRITPPIAQAIINEYPTLPALSRAFRRADEEDARVNGGSGAGGSVILEKLQKATNRNGGFSDRTVGKAISRRVYGVFMERDPGSTRV